MPPSPPKPWEVAGASAAPAAELQDAQAPLAAAPDLPVRPAATASALANRPAYTSPYSRFGAGGYNSAYGNGYNSGYTSGYGGAYGAGYGGTYGSGYSPYSRYGSGYGNYGYGGSYASGYGGGFGRFGPGDPDAPLSARLEQSTMATFQTLEQVVQAFGGFAQMLDSTLMATHSSFMAMAGVAEQLGHFRNYLGQILSMLSIASFLRDLFARLSGRRSLQPALEGGSGFTVSEFSAFNQNRSAANINSSQPNPSSPNRRPVWVFLALAVGLPWAISRLVSALERRRLANGQDASEKQPSMQHNESLLHPSQIRDLVFCRALHAFAGDAPGDLPLQPGDIVAVLSKTDPETGQPSMWWKGRTQSGRIGIFPSNYVETIKKSKSNAAPNATASPKRIDSTSTSKITDALFADSAAAASLLTSKSAPFSAKDLAKEFTT